MGIKGHSLGGYCILVRVTIAVMTRRPKQLGEERVNLAYTFPSLFPTEGNQDKNSNWAGNWRPETTQRLWSSTAYWLAPHGLLSLLSFKTQDHQHRVALPTMG